MSNNSIWGDSETLFFDQLLPDDILNSIEALNLKTSGRILTLNSMENRVYEIEIYDPSWEILSPSDNFVIAKFYRPGRWSIENILDEHEFMLDLKNGDVSVIEPIMINEKSVFKMQERAIYYSLFKKRSGRIEPELGEEKLLTLGRTLGRLHNIGENKTANNRMDLNFENFILNNSKIILNSKLFKAEYKTSLEQITQRLKQINDNSSFDQLKKIRIHGDCHYGNILWRDELCYLIDFDDMLNGIEIQDIWLALTTLDLKDQNAKNIFIDGYETFREYPYHQERYIQILRSYRQFNYAAWILKRIEDDSFKRNFPHMIDGSFWPGFFNDLNLILDSIQNPQGGNY